ncbi:hypothetical protein NicSoilC12_28610 [Arthrobacter sp. NicSoilC12]|nr:hypothetical protein NicSoilC12_28610 [Arthrobacter sp. NicSoilC12]
MPETVPEPVPETADPETAVPETAVPETAVAETAVPDALPDALPADAALTVAGLSESQLLGRIFPRLTIPQPNGGPAASYLLLGPGDDAAIVAAPDGRTVLSIDTQVADQDFRLEWNNGYRTTGYDVGWKAAAQNLSDINAMGAQATSVVVSLTMPPETLVSWVEDFADGLVAGIRGLGAPACAVAGGDLGRGRELAVSVAILGTLDGKEPVLRSGGPAGGHRGPGGNSGPGRRRAGAAGVERPGGRPDRRTAFPPGHPVQAAAAARRRTAGP